MRNGNIQNEEHEILLDDVMLDLGSLPSVRIWKRIVGFDTSKNLKYGINGESDLEGIVAPHGRMLCVEIKTGKARLSKDQIRRKTLIEKFGGIWITARSREQALREFYEKNNILA